MMTRLSKISIVFLSHMQNFYRYYVSFGDSYLSLHLCCRRASLCVVHNETE